MPQEYRISDSIASGFPISRSTTLGYMRDITRTDFGKRLYESRKLAKLTQAALAKKVGISQGTLAELEKIGQGSAYTPQLAKACGVSPEWLASGEAEAAPSAKSLSLSSIPFQPPTEAAFCRHRETTYRYFGE